MEEKKFELCPLVWNWWEHKVEHLKSDVPRRS